MLTGKLKLSVGIVQLWILILAVTSWRVECWYTVSCMQAGFLVALVLWLWNLLRSKMACEGSKGAPFELRVFHFLSPSSTKEIETLKVLERILTPAITQSLTLSYQFWVLQSGTAVIHPPCPIYVPIITYVPQGCKPVCNLNLILFLNLQIL